MEEKTLEQQIEWLEKEIERMASLHSEARETIQDLREKLAEANLSLKALEETPRGFGMHIRHVGYKKISVPSRTGEEEEKEYPVVDIRDSTGRDSRVLVLNEKIDPKTLQYGQRVLLLSNQIGHHVVEALGEFTITGREGYVQEMLSSDHEGPRVLVSYGDGFQEKLVAHIGANVAEETLEEGKRVLINPTDGRVVEVLPDSLSREYLMRELPDVRFENIGGHDEIIGRIEEEIAWPFLHPREYESLGLKPPKGILLVGPPGVGKTMIAKAIVNFLADFLRTQFGRDAQGHFFRVRGPELLNMWLGNTEGAMRRIFREAAKVASPDHPAVIFFDEAEALFPVRGSGISSDFGNQTVAQFNALLDGPEARENVVVILATNRRGLLDPAIARPGRLDKIINVPRPNAQAAEDIFKKHFKADWSQIHSKYDQPVYVSEDRQGRPRGEQYQFDNDPERARDYLISRAIARIYDSKDPRNKFFELRAGGVVRQTYRFGDFLSGADIAEIVNRAKFASFRAHKEKGEPLGVQTVYLFRAIESLFSEKYVPPDVFNLRQWLYTEGKDNIPFFDEVVILNVKKSEGGETPQISQKEWEDL